MLLKDNVRFCGALLLIGALIISNTEASESSEVASAFVASQIVHDMLPSPPSRYLEASFGNYAIQLGNKLNSTLSKTQPTVRWDAGEDEYFSLFLLDPDAYARDNPMLRSYVHWFVGNVQGNEVSTGIEYQPYVSPVPAICTGEHRYVLLLYKQPGFVNYGGHRFVRFKPAEYAAEYGLGEPLAGNFFLSEFDDCNTYYTTISQRIQQCEQSHYEC